MLFEARLLNVASSRFAHQCARHRFGGRFPNVVVIARISLAIFVALGAGAASGEIYKCTAKKRITTYQNFPCEFDSLGAANLPAEPTGPLTATPVSTNTSKHANRTAVTAVPRVGMTRKEVRAVWGEPLETTREEFVKGDIETWKYADSRSIRFDPKGRVQQIKW